MNTKGRKGAQNEHRLNDDITAETVRVLNADGEQAGIYPIEQALEMAETKGVDLIEVVPNATPPVCRVMDYGKFQFEDQKKKKVAKQKQQTASLKEITLRPGTEEHDYQVKLKKITQFIEKGSKVKVTIRFRGRELAHKDVGMEQLERIVADMQELAKVDSKPRMEGRQMHMLLSPLSKK
mgnify:CR=1 FL=1